ncbi:hypothetical protein AKJ09_04683 [Labilithrix luteola]|uniref:DNA binding HTH domain-containing protein n=1 Tax=Labilithrix luteola TaxID=1391654 RepID=A0A0K1PXZ3_9BACT|nr:hypothetical protein AKJ09_04683 [Labilithrix luteola]
MLVTTNPDLVREVTERLASHDAVIAVAERPEDARDKLASSEYVAKVLDHAIMRHDGVGSWMSLSDLASGDDVVLVGPIGSDPKRAAVRVGVYRRTALEAMLDDLGRIVAEASADMLDSEADADSDGATNTDIRPIALDGALDGALVVPSAALAGGAAGTSLRRIERELIVSTFESCARNLSRTARQLDIARSTLRDKLRRYGLR